MSSSGQKSGKARERANFVNHLSQHLKVKRHIGDTSVGITSKHETKVAGLETISKPNLVVSTTSNVKSSDFFPGIGSFGATTSKEGTPNNTDSRKPEIVEPNEDGQLTIFFCGQVLVYNSFPVDKIKDIMVLANQGCSTASCNNNAGGGGADDDSVVTEKVNTDIQKIDHSSHSDKIPDLNITSSSAASPNSPTAQDPLPDDHNRHQCSGSDLQIARRNSLHKFLSMRNNRAAARAPYPVNNLRGGGGSPLPPVKPDENKSSSEHEEG